jgi:F-type H+-transporting ATPase subunit a
VKHKKLIWGVVALILLAALVGFDILKAPGQAHEFEVAAEFELHPIVTLPTIGPFDMSINKAVVYLWITAAVLILAAVIIRLSLKQQPGRFQVVIETLYGLAHDGIVGAVMKSGRATWFPFVAGVFFFVLTANLIGLVPLPFAEHSQLGFYTATANLYVTLALALCTFVFTHYAGIRQNGGLRYFKNWAPPSAPPVLRQLIWVIHAVSEIFRLVSLAVRLFANMLAGHAILAVFFAMALIFQSYLAAVFLQGASVLIYLFEIFVAFIQAFIFAILSAVYIGGALDQEH